MKINFKIVKHHHLKGRDARALLGHIQHADVISLENAGGLESEACSIELEHRKSINLRRDPVRHAKRLRKLGVGDYAEEMERQLLRYAKPVVLLERFGRAESAQLSDISEATRYERVVDTFVHGDLEEALHEAFSIAEDMKKGVKLRDANMARNGRTIGKRILDLYPRLGEKTEITYAVSIGTLHSPEEGLRETVDGDVEVVIVPPQDPSPHTNWLNKIFRRVLRENAVFEDCRRDLARFVLANFYLQSYRGFVGGSPLALPISYLGVADMGMDDLSVLHALMRTKGGLKVVGDFFEERDLPSPLKSFQCDPVYERLAKEHAGKD